MKKEEFPTFLNERPAIIFGRDGRQLLIITIGLALAFFSWLRLGIFIHGNMIASDLVKGIIAIIIVLFAGMVAFVKVAARPLEEWAFVWLFYVIIPKVYLYMPAEVGILSEKPDDKQDKSDHVAADDDFEDD